MIILTINNQNRYLQLIILKPSDGYCDWLKLYSCLFSYVCRQRPYHVESTGSRPITEVKQRRARLVLGWVTAWEHRVLLANFFLFFSFFFFLFFFPRSFFPSSLSSFFSLFFLFFLSFCFYGILIFKKIKFKAPTGTVCLSLSLCLCHCLSLSLFNLCKIRFSSSSSLSTTIVF